MAFEVEAWWSANYNKYSIRDLQRLPIFHRFVQIHYPFERSDQRGHERFYVVNGEVDIFEWKDNNSSRFEKFQHDRKLDQYHYEIHFTDADSPVVIRSWLQAELEWGEIIRDFTTFELHEGWRLEPPNRTYERFTVEQGIKKGFRAGIHPFKGDYERWVEDFWEFGNEKMFKKQWYKEGESGGETTNQKADYVWGENWFSSSKRFEKKCWHKDGAHQWGHDLGKEPPKRWDHTWDVNPEEKYEEKVTVENGRDTGYRYWGNKGDWYKQEWEGLKMLEREDRCEEVVSSKIRERLDNLYTREYNSDLKQQSMLSMLAMYHPVFQPKVQALEARIAEVHLKDREDVEKLFDSIEALRGIGDDQEDLTFELFRSFRDDFDLLQTFNTFFIKSLQDSMKTLERIGKLVQDDTAFQEWLPKVEEFDKMPLGTLLKGKKGMQLLGELEKTKFDELANFRGGIPQAELEHAMETLYQIMVKHDAVSDKIVELTHADDLKAKLDSMEDMFGVIHQNFLEEGDPNKLHEMLNLLLDYQPIHLHLMNRLRGYTREESNSEVGAIDSAVQETKGAPSLKNTRAKVRSGRPTRETPFQTMENNLNRFAPALQRLLAAVDAPKSEIAKVTEMVQKSTASGEPVEVIMEKTRLLTEIAANSLSAVDTHETTVKESDTALNVIFDQSLPSLQLLGDQEAIDKRSALVQQSAELDYLPRLVLEKVLSLKSTGPALTDLLTAKDAELAAKDKELAERLKELADLLEKTRGVDDELAKFLPQYDGSLKSLGTPEDVRQPIISVSSPTSESPLDELLAKVHALNSVAAGAHPSVAQHDATLKETDTVLNKVMEDGLAFLELLGDHDVIAVRKGLVGQSASTEYLPPLVLEKAKNIKEKDPEIADWVNKKLAQLAAALNKSKGANDELNKFIPRYVDALKSLGAPNEVRDPVSVLADSPLASDNPASELEAKIASLNTAAEAAEPTIQQHDDTLKQADLNLNSVIETTLPDLQQVEDGPELAEKAKALVALSPSTDYLPPLVLAKTENLSRNLPKLADKSQKAAEQLADVLGKLAEARDDLNHFIPFYVNSIKSVGSPESVVAAAESLKADESRPVADAVLDQVRGLRIVGASEQKPIEEHDTLLKETDGFLNAALEAGLDDLPHHEGGAELADKHRGLIAASPSTAYLNPLVHAKSQELSQRSLFNAGELRKLPKLSASLFKFIPLFKAHLDAVNAPEEHRDRLAQAAVFPENLDTVTLDVLAEKSEQVLASAEGAAPALAEHVDTILKSDANINQYFEATFGQYQNMEGAQENIIEPREALISRSAEPYLVPVVLAKTEELLAHTSEMDDWLLSIEESQTTTTNQIEELNFELANRSLIIEDLRKKIKELEKKITILEEDVENSKKFKPLFDSKCDEATALSIELNKMKLAFSDEKLAHEALKDELERITPELAELRDFKTRSLDMVNENERLKGIIKNYDEMFGDKKAQFEEVIGELNSELANRDSEIRDLLERIKKMESELELKEKDRRKQLMLRVIGALANTLKSEKTNTFLAWHLYANLPEEMPSNSIMDEAENPAGFVDEELAPEPLAKFAATEAPLVAERVSQLPANNILSKFWKIAGGRFEKPATPIENIPFWDEMISKFHDVCIEDFEAKRRPMIFAEFTLETLFKALATRVSVVNRLGVHIPTLYRLYQAGHPYAVVIARMLHLFNGSPAPLACQFILSVYRKQFEELSAEYEKERRGANPIAASDLAITGGLARLETVLAKFVGMFEDPKFVVEHWLRHVKPSKVSASDFVLVALHKALLKADVDPDAFWIEVDDGEGNTDSARFVEAGVKYSKFSAKLLKEVSAKPITREHFWEMQSIDEDDYVVSKGSFLLGVLEAYIAGVRRQTVDLTDLFATSGLPAVNKDQFSGLVQTLEAVEGEIVGKIYEEGLTISETKDGLDLGAFVRVLLRYPLGRLANPPLGVLELGKLTDVHPREYDWLEGRKTVVTKTTTKITTTKVRVVKK